MSGAGAIGGVGNGAGDKYLNVVFSKPAVVTLVITGAVAVGLVAVGAFTYFALKYPQGPLSFFAKTAAQLGNKGSYILMGTGGALGLAITTFWIVNYIYILRKINKDNAQPFAFAVPAHTDPQTTAMIQNLKRTVETQGKQLAAQQQQIESLTGAEGSSGDHSNLSFVQN